MEVKIASKFFLEKLISFGKKSTLGRTYTNEGSFENNIATLMRENINIFKARLSMQEKEALTEMRRRNAVEVKSLTVKYANCEYNIKKNKLDDSFENRVYRRMEQPFCAALDNQYTYEELDSLWQTHAQKVIPASFIIHMIISGDPNRSKALEKLRTNNINTTEAKYYNFFSEKSNLDPHLKEEIYQRTAESFYKTIIKLEDEVEVPKALWISTFYKRCENVWKYEYGTKKRENSVKGDTSFWQKLGQFFGIKNHKALEMDANEILKQVVRDMPELQVTCFEQFTFEGMDYADIAKVHGISANTVRRYCKRVEEKFRDAWDKYQDE